MSNCLTRKRLDVPQVHDLLGACHRMLDHWAETDPASPERRRLWLDVHHAADALTMQAYGGETWRTRASYWLRPYDARLDRRVWRWQVTRAEVAR